MTALLKTALRNVRRNPRRTILTTVSIGTSLGIFALLMSLPGVFNLILADRAGSLRVICHSISGPLYPVPEAYANRIRTQPHVQAVAAFEVFPATYQGPSDQVLSFGIDHEQFEQVFPDWQGSPDSLKAFVGLRTGALVGAALMKRFAWHVGQHITLKGTMYPVNVELEIVGEPGGKAPPIAIFFHRQYLEELLGKPGRVNEVWARVDSSAAIPQVIAELDEGFANSEAPTQTESEIAFFTTMTSGLRVVIDLAKALAMFVVAAMMLVALNTAAMSIRERRTELAVLRAIGFTGGTVLSSLVFESLLMGLAGALAGCALALGVLKVLRVGFGVLGPLASALHMPAAVIGETLLAGALMGILAALMPGLRATRGNIVDQLRVTA